MRPAHEVSVAEVESDGRVSYEVSVCGYVEDDFPTREEAEGVAQGIIDGTLAHTVRTAIAGVPRAGKTTLAAKIAQGGHRSTDDLIGLGWSEASAAAASWFNDSDEALVVEGMAVPRALRKWLATHPEGRPVDRVIWMGHPHVHLTPGQVTMGQGAHTVMREIIPDLILRRVTVIDFNAPRRDT